MSTEHYLIVKGYKNPDGSLYYRIDPDAGYVVMGGRPIWDDDVDDFIRVDGQAEAEHTELYEELSRRLTQNDPLIGDPS